ncbi:DUF1983 domain-containing protein [Aeromonas sp. Prich7-2]|uniref:phage tail tip fiber protein n=1 Tax=Aeromonas sp. Prich7-2 TaxID=2823361 RepID=UPI001B3263F6|nr:DUF1983 domain-containing protein [Aeromonas sp. Prich7-2]MBP4059624.1 DUF1983 domain-containing protein [Aeromonas sp. Prich7-2]
MAKKPAYRAGRDQAATVENVELLTGQRGDRLDKAVTFRELEALGLSTLRPGAGGVYVPGKNPDLFPAGQMDFPHAPVNVIANGAFHTVLVEWDPPQYRGHAHAEIWRAESDNQAEATLVGTSSANLFSDAIGKGATFYYWVRFVNGKDDKGPFQGMQGVKAETSRDVQDILDELQGKIEKSHLVQELLNPIEAVPQLQLDVTILKPKVDEIEVIRPKVDAIEGKIPSIEQDIAILKPKVDEIEVISPKVAAIEVKIPSIEQELAGLDERQKVAQELLDDAQQQLGMSSIEIGLVQDRLNAKIDKYKGDFDSFRDAVFVVDPENGSITMDAVNAVRDELHTSIAEVQQDLDAVAGQISSKADNVTVDGQGKRITEAEQRINGLDASLSQTVTKGEFTDEQQRVTQIGQELNATKGELTQKAAQQEVDEHGERLANAESKLTVHTDELSSQAQRLDGLAAQITQGDETLRASITELARVSAESDQVTAQRVDGLAAQITQGDETLRASITELARVSAESDQVTTQRVSGLEVRAGASEAKIQALEEIFADDGGITAGRFDAITAELELQRGNDDDNASAAIDGALAVDERDRETRKAFGAIRTEQRVILTEQQAQAQRTADMEVKFEAKDAATQARISSVEKVTSDADSALAQRIDNVTTEFKAADAQVNADILSLARSSAAADEALSLRQDQLAATLSSATADLAANITQEESARVTADEAISRRVSEVEAQFSSDLEDTNARIAAEELARATKDEALAQQISTVDAAFKAADTALSASLAESSKAMADADRALGERISTLDVTVGENSASITELQQAVVSNEASISQRQDKMESEVDIGAASLVEGALTGDERDRENRKARGVILQQQSTLANQQEAQARTVEQLTAEFDAETADLKAQITNEQLTRATADEALSQRISVVDAEYKAANADTNAVISALEQSSASADEALSLRQDQLAAELTSATAELAANITQEESARVTADEAISRRVSEVEAQFGSDLEDAKARVAAEELARATKDEALAQQISTVDAAFKAADTALSASLSESSKALADSDRALGERISAIDVTVGDNAANITELQRVVVSNEESQSQRQDKLESEVDIGAASLVEGALTGDERDRENRKARGVILQQQSTLANQQEAQARTVEQLTAEFDAENGEIRAQITNEQLVRSTADEALAQKTSVLEAQIEGVDQSLSASIAEVARVSADADAVMTEKLNQQQSTMQTADAELSSRINEEATTRADAVESLASQIQQVTADFQKGDDSLSGQITTESEARATADGALGKRIDTVAAQAGELESAVQTQSQAIADLENGAQAMWSVKAQAGDIKAGIGLVAKSDGTSQVMVSASQFFVFNPNSPNATAPLFAIDNGQTVIAEAIIRKATIQIIQSEKITADYVKAGVSMSAPAISGGSIDMGNAFLSGGAAGFGKGGPYGGWSWTWHTIIYADGSLYTDRLFASNGSFTGTVNANAGTFQNVTIEETCNVKGTVYANKIVGDVLSAKVVSANSTDSAGSGHVVASASVKGSRTHAANLYCLGVTVEVYASGGYRPGGNDQDVPATISGRLVLTNSAGGIIATAPFKVRSGSNISIAAASQSITIQGGFDAGTGAASISCAVIIDSQSASYGGSAGVRVPAQSIAFCLLPSGSQFN